MSRVKNLKLWRRVLEACGAVLVATALLAAPAAAQSGFTVDVWTNKGGTGTGSSGGSYGVNDELIVYFRASHDCVASIALARSGEDPMMLADAQLGGGETYQMKPTVAGSELVGSWVMTVSACTNMDCASDSVTFTVGTAGQAVFPPAVTALTADTATALDALKALKMSQGAMGVDLAYDVDHNGSVNADDARLILKWAVE